MATSTANDHESLDQLESNIARLLSRQSQKLDRELQPVTSSYADHTSLVTVLDGLSNQIVRLRSEVTSLVCNSKDSKHQTFGQANFTKEQKQRAQAAIQIQKQEKSVALDHALVLVQHLLKTQTVNMELKNSLREMQAKMSENGLDCDNSVSRMSMEGPGTPEAEDEDLEDDDSYESDDSERCSIMPGSNLMEQIHNLETKESANRMGLSQKAPKSKAIKVKQNSKLGQSQKPTQQPMNKLGAGGATPKAQHREKVEHEKLYKVVQQTFRAQILEDEKYKIPYDLFNQESDECAPDQYTITTNFEKMRAHYNCLSELEQTHGDLNKADRLREVLRQNAFLLGLVSSKNKNMKLELNFLQRNYDRLSREKGELQTLQKTSKGELEIATAKLYDIEYDAY